MTILLHPRAWPLVMKVPVLVALLMVGVAAVISQLVFASLIENQERNLRQLTETYLDGVSTALMSHVIRRDPWETFDILDRAQGQYTDVKTRVTLVTLPDGSILAASDPKMFPIGANVPAVMSDHFKMGERLVIDENTGSAWANRPLMEAGQVIGELYAEIDVASLFLERQNVLMTLIFGNSLLAFMFAVGGYLAVRRMVEPIGILSDYVEGLRDGAIDPIPDELIHDERTEFGKLFRRFNKMKVAIDERESLSAHLAEEEKLALIGKLASAMAHEVNNPLGGMGNAINTIRVHGDDPKVRNSSLDLLDRGLEGIANVVRAALVTYKGREDPDHLNRGDIEDLQHLINHDVVRKKIKLAWNNALPGTVALEGGATRQILLNLLLNACAASPVTGEVRFDARLEDGWVVMIVEDQGPGIPAPILAQFSNPDIKGLSQTGGGLGVWTVGTLAKRMGAEISVDAPPSGGTKITLKLPVNVEGGIHAVA